MKKLRHLELLAALVITALAVILHLHNTAHVGGLWRDEVNSVQMAEMPAFTDVCANLQFDSFPILWFATLRSWLSLGLNSDLALRIFGCSIGILVLGALWLNARFFTKSPPLLALTLLGLNPAVIRWGDSIRGYGLGLLFSVGLLAAIWLLIQKPHWKQFSLTLLVCLLATQTLYYNAVLLCAVGIAGALICTLDRKWKSLAYLVAVGAICALCIVPYFPSMKQASTWNILVKKEDFGFPWFLGRLGESLGPLGTFWDTVLWLALILSILLLVILGWSKSSMAHTWHRQMFLILSLALAFIAYYGFLKLLSYDTHAWYYLALIGFAVVVLDACSSFFSAASISMTRLITCSVIALVWFPFTWKQLGERMTNIDLVADTLAKSASANDFVVMDPWEPGIAFSRYYKGAASWMTVPPVNTHKLHRFDLVKSMMTQVAPVDAIKPVLESVMRTLKAGGKVWLVGAPQFLPAGYHPITLPPAPNSPYKWKNVAYYAMWSQQLGYFIQTHAQKAEPIKVEEPPTISEFEHLPIILIEGWRE